MWRIRSSIRPVFSSFHVPVRPVQMRKSSSARPTGCDSNMPPRAVTNVFRSENRGRILPLHLADLDGAYTSLSTGNLARVGTAESSLPGGADGSVGVVLGGEDAGEDDKVAGLEARVGA